MSAVKEQDTRSRLLNAAMALFAERGFGQTTMAAISERSEANIAAVNYHFGDKRALYVEALRAAFAEANRVYPVTPTDEAMPAEGRLRQHIHAMISQIFCVSDAGSLCRMVAKEFAEPTFAVDMIFSELISQNRAQMWSTVSDLLGPEMPEPRIHLAMVSIVAQFQFYNFSRLIREMGARSVLNLPDPDAIAEHIYQFSLAGLKGMLEADAK
jgi:AcrR family transcriptional regulator